MARATSLSVGAGEELAAELREGGEAHRAEHAVGVHVPDPLVDVVAAGAHVVEGGGLDAVLLGRAADHRVEPDVGDLVAVVDPDVGAVRPCGSGSGARSWYLAGSRPSNMSGGSTTWSSTLTRIRSSVRIRLPLLEVAGGRVIRAESRRLSDRPSLMRGGPVIAGGPVERPLRRGPGSTVGTVAVPRHRSTAAWSQLAARVASGGRRGGHR